MNGMSPPARHRRPWLDETRNGSARRALDGVPRIHEDLLTPIYNELGGAELLSDHYSDHSHEQVSATPMARNSNASFDPDPPTAPILIPTPMSGQLHGLPPYGPPASPVTQPQTSPPMSAFARERAAVEAMLAALSLRAAPQVADRRTAARPAAASPPTTWSAYSAVAPPRSTTRRPGPAAAHLLRT